MCVCVSSDNASNVRLMRDLLQESRPDLLYTGCQAHCLNLLLKDLANDVPVLEKILEILKWVGNNAVAELRLHTPPLPQPPVPNDTRYFPSDVLSSTVLSPPLQMELQV